MTFGLRCFQPARRPHPASLPVRVPTVESLLRASFSFTSRLRLAFRYGCRHRLRLAPFIQLDSAHAGHTGTGVFACHRSATLPRGDREDPKIPLGCQFYLDRLRTDTHCMKPDIKCVQLCVRKGSKYGLWSGKRVYVLEPQSQAARFAAQNVKVTGTLSGDTIHIASIESGKRPH